MICVTMIQWSEHLIARNWMFIKSSSSSLLGSLIFSSKFPNHAQHVAANCFDQLDRASLSALLNTAEGNGKRQGRQRAKFFDDARGSAIECAACLDAAVAKRFVSPHRIQPGKEMLGRVVAMLTRLVDRFDTEESLYRSAI